MDWQNARQGILDEFSGIIQCLGAKVLVDGDGLFIIGQRTDQQPILWLTMERDGLEMSYVRRSRGGKFTLYPLIKFLAHRSNYTVTSGLPEAETWAHEIIAGARYCVDALNGFGTDILAGDEAWIAEYESDGSKPYSLTGKSIWKLQTALGQCES